MYDNMFIQNGLLEVRPLQLCSRITMYCQTMFQYIQVIMDNDQTEKREQNAPENEGLQDVTEEPIQQQGLYQSIHDRRPPETLGTWIMY